MPDIIKQLEEGKKIQEEEGIDTEALRTKLDSSEEEPKQKTKRKRKPKKQETEDKIEEQKSEESSEQTANEPVKEQKPEKYPGFDFNDYYEKGQIIFYVKVHEKLGIKDLLELKIRTIYPKMMVAVEDKKCTHCIGPDTKDMIFVDRKTASEAYNEIDIKTLKDTNPEDEIGIEIQDTEE